MTDYAATPWREGFVYPECPRWHEGHLWLSDQHAGLVYQLDGNGHSLLELAVPGNPSGLGWLPDGSLLVVSMKNRCLYRLPVDALPDGMSDSLEDYADFSALHGGHSNDMVVDSQGMAYVGNIGFDFYAGEENRDTVLTLVSGRNEVSVAAEGVNVPNGSIVTPDGKHLIVAESLQGKLTRFTIEDDGSLNNRTTLAELEGHVPDGICLDTDNHIWASSPFTQSVVRVSPEGEITDTVSTPGINPYACVFGGEKRQTLYICCAGNDDPAKSVIEKSGRIDTVELPFTGAGIP